MDQQPNQSPQPEMQPQKPMNKTWQIAAIVVAGILVIGGVAAGSYYLWQKSTGNFDQKACTMEAKLCSDGSSVGRTGPNCEFTACPSVSASPDSTADWQTYKNEQYGFEVKYPSKLELNTKNIGTNVVELRHSVLYENTGDCDMAGPQPFSTTLDDLAITFEIKNEKVKLSFDDGDFSAGTLKGKFVYEGIEGCGPSAYYFPFKENGTLIVRFWIPQLLSGVINSETDSVKKLLSVPGVITGDESIKIFNQILSTFKFTK